MKCRWLSCSFNWAFCRSLKMWSRNPLKWKRIYVNFGVLMCLIQKTDFCLHQSSKVPLFTLACMASVYVLTDSQRAHDLGHWINKHIHGGLLLKTLHNQLSPWPWALRSRSWRKPAWFSLLDLTLSNSVNRLVWETHDYRTLWMRLNNEAVSHHNKIRQSVSHRKTAVRKLHLTHRVFTSRSNFSHK